MPVKSSRQRYLSYRYLQEKKNGKSKTKSGPKSNRHLRRRYLEQYRSWLWPYRLTIALLFILAAISAGFEMAFPLATRYIIDELLLSPSPPENKWLTLHLLAAGVAILLIGSQGLEIYRSNRTSILNARVVFSLRGRLYDRLIKLPLSQIADLKSGGIVSRLSSDVDNVTGLVQMAVISPGVALLRMLFTVAILIVIKWELALVAAGMLPLFAYVSLLWVKKGRPVYKSMAEDRSNVDGRVAETFGGIRVVRGFRRERKEAFDYAVGHHTIIRKKVFANMIEILVDSGWHLVISLVGLLIVWLGGILYLMDQASIGDIVAFQMYSAMFLEPVWRIINSVSRTQQALASMDRVFEILERQADKPDRSDAVEAPPCVETIEFRSVWFEYKSKLPVLRDLNLKVRGGQIIAVVGPSGAGKTTLTDLVARFHDPTSGCILLNGMDLRKIKLESYRKLFGVVQQDVFLFDGTVLENIAYGHPNAPFDSLVEAAKRAHAHDFILRLPDGYYTLIGERGVKLSGGQRQRLSIARAILADPQILILDEATSNLDTESEQKIQMALRELFVGRTTFVIAHRLSTVTHADLIVVLEQGLIKETGNHRSLMDMKGVYYSMVERQRSLFHLIL